MQELNYGRSLAATFLGAIVASVIMVIPAWFWSEVVLDVPFSSIVGRHHGLDTSDRSLLYGGHLIIVFVGFLVYTWCVKWLYRSFQHAELEYWDTFAALIATGILAALVGYALPFVGLLIAVFVAPVFVNGSTQSDVIRGGAPRGGVTPDSAERLTATSELR